MIYIVFGGCSTTGGEGDGSLIIGSETITIG